MGVEHGTARSTAWPLYLIGALFFVGLLALVMWNVELPYLAFSPGPVADAPESIIVEGPDTFAPEGELLMLTILSQDVNLIEAVIAGFDPTVDLVRKQAVRREGETDEEYRSRVLEMMDQSNYRSIAAAMNYLGIELVPIEVVIVDIVEGVPAADVLRLDDTIVSIEGTDIGSSEDIGPLLEGRRPGDTVAMTVARNGTTQDVEVTLAEREDEPGVPMIGIVPDELQAPPFTLRIEAGDVGGPSAGMMHALAIIDLLTEGELTKGRVIAGTGTIVPDGTVGAIGGIRQKVVAAEAAGAEVILVPEGNYASALTAERDDIEIVAVATLEEAVDYLENLDPA